MAPEAQELIIVVEKIIDQRRDEPRVSPTWVATEAMVKLDPGRVSLPLVYLGCHLHLRQIARGQLRLHFEDPAAAADDDLAQHELFPDLQRRYPAARPKRRPTSEPEYVLLEAMSDADYTFNLNRLRREGRAKLDHADALEAHWRELKRGAA